MNFNKLSRLNFLRHWNINGKLAAGYGVLLVLVALMAMTSFIGLQSMRNDIRTALEKEVRVSVLGHKISEALLEARRNEKDFLLRWRFEGYERAYKNYLIPNQIYIRNIRQYSLIVEPLVAASDSQELQQIRSQLDILRAQLEIYEQELQDITSLVERRGFQDTGLEGEFIENIHNLENSVLEIAYAEDMQLTLLQTRRNEKDYLLSGDQRYVGNVHEFVDQLREQVIVYDFSAEGQAEKYQQIDNYANAFDALVETDREIAIKTENLRNAAQNIEPIALQIQELGDQAADQTASRIEIVNRRLTSSGAIFLILAGIIGVGVVYVLTKQIVAPIQQLALTAQQVTAGNRHLRFKFEQHDEIGTTGTAFNQMLDELTTTLDSLDELVAERTSRLEILATLGERLSSILNVDQLLTEIVNQVKDNFGYYHSHIYLFDEKTENLVVVAGTGEAGAQMKAEKYSISAQALQSLVAQAARGRDIIKVDNVREAEGWLPNALLPDTYCEMAVPIVLDGQVVGVLDVQEDVVAGLDEGDASLLRSLANQIAVAIGNARLFTQVENALADARAAQARYQEQAWGKSKITSQKGSYHYTRPGAVPLLEEVVAEAKRQRIDQNHPGVVTIGKNGSDLAEESESQEAIIAPITVQNTNVGTLYLQSASKDQTWTEDDLVIVEAVIDQLGQVAENLRLFDETRQRAGREQLARQITDKIRSSRDLETAMKTAAEELSDALNLSTTKIKWQAPSENKVAKNLQETRNGAANNYTN